MKRRIGFVSNSSTASFVVKTKPTEWDYMSHNLSEEDVAAITLPKEKVELLKESGFYPTKEENPFREELNTQIGDGSKAKTKDDTLLAFWISSNHDYALQFLVAHDIPFKAAVHYGQYLYTYDPKDKCIYRLQNFGIEYLKSYKDLEAAINKEDDYDWIDIEPLKVIDRKEFLKDYNEKESLMMMGGPLTN